MLFLPFAEDQATQVPCVFTVDEVMQTIGAFLAAVSDMSTPRCCPYCLAVLAFDLGTNAAALDALQKHAYVFWKTCLRLIVHYTTDDIPRLRKRLHENQMACKDRAVYHKHRLSFTSMDAFDIFINALLYIVGTGLTEGARPAYSGGRLAKFHNRKEYWPRHLDDLFPMEVTRIIDGILHWVCAPSTAFPLAVLNIYLLTARAVVFPALMEPSRRKVLAWGLLQVMTPDRPTVPWSGAAPFTMPAGLCVPRMLRRDSMLCDVAVFTLRIIRSDEHARTDDDRAFLERHEALFLDALESMDVARPIAPNTRYTLDGLRRALAMRIDTVSTYRCTLRALLGREHDACDPGVHIVPGTELMLYRFLKRCSNATYCSNAGCMRAELDGHRSARPFQKCALCGSVWYCSVECQRHDWKMSNPTHKELCSTIAVLRHRVQSAGADEFAANFDQIDEFTPAKVEMLEQWAKASGRIPRSWIPRSE